jgi:conjugal transfer pilus assembly protein TraU
LASNTGLANDKLFWCAGCLGSIYPLSGNVSSHIGGVQASSLLATRVITKMHKLGLARQTATKDGSFNGKLCKKQVAPIIKKSQYRLQMTYPIPATKGPFTCNTPGMSDMLYNQGKEFPYKGEDFGYLLWRKKNCCLRAM